VGRRKKSHGLGTIFRSGLKRFDNFMSAEKAPMR
jgi:hypothetical protein